MTFRKLLAVLVLTVTAFTLVACKPKTPEDLVKNVLKDSYTGYSDHSGYDQSIFSKGGSNLIFDKTEHTISNGDDTYFYEVVPEENLPTSAKGIFTQYDEELKGKDYFLINVSYNQDDIWGKLGDQLYCIVLTEGGKQIRIFEFETGYSADGYYDFSGVAD